jgi:hypothetical protein
LLILALLPAVFAVVACLLFGVVMLLTSPEATVLGLFKLRRQPKPPLAPEAATTSAIEAAGTEGAEGGPLV